MAGAIQFVVDYTYLDKEIKRRVGTFGVGFYGAQGNICEAFSLLKDTKAVLRANLT